MARKGGWTCSCSKHGGLEHRLRSRHEWRQHQRAEEIRCYNQTQGTTPALDLTEQPPIKRRRTSASTVARVEVPEPQPFFIEEGSVHSSHLEHKFKAPRKRWRQRNHEQNSAPPTKTPELLPDARQEKHHELHSESIGKNTPQGGA